MADNIPINADRPRRPLTVGLFWFAVLSAATALGTGSIRLPTQLGWNETEEQLGSESSASVWHATDQVSATLTAEGTDESPPPPLVGFEERLRRRLSAPDPVPGSERDESGTEQEPQYGGVGFSQEDDRESLTLQVNVPDSAALGELVTFEIKLKNETSLPAANVNVACAFGEQFEFPGSTESVLRQKLGSIQSGESRSVMVSLRTRLVGRGCLQLDVTSDSHARASREECLIVESASPAETRSPPLDVLIVGPRRRTVGSRAEFLVTLVNHSLSDVPATDVAISYDTSLRLKEVSAGAERSPGRLRWELGTVLSNERIQIQLEFECAAEVDASPLTVEVTSNRNDIARAETVIEVSERPELDLQLSDLADPLVSGGRSTFLLEVHNHSAQPARDIVLHLVPSQNIEILAARARQEGRKLDLEVFVEGNRLYLEKAPPLEPGSTLTCEIEFEAGDPGTGVLTALLQSRALATPLEVREPLVINPALSGD